MVSTPERRHEPIIDFAAFRHRSDVEIIGYPDRIQDERGVEFWRRIVAIMQDESRRRSVLI